MFCLIFCNYWCYILTIPRLYNQKRFSRESSYMSPIIFKSLKVLEGLGLFHQALKTKNYILTYIS